LTCGGGAPLLEPLAVGRAVDSQLRLHAVGFTGDGEALLELVARDVQCPHARATTIAADRRRVALVADRTGVPVTRDRARGDVRERQSLDTEEFTPPLDVVARLEVLDAVAVAGQRHGLAA